MRYKNNFVIHTTEQLIDINKSLKNFEADVSITTQNEDDSFSIVIVTQRQLDDSDFQLNYKTIQHYVNVNIKSKKNEDNDYVLVIKSDNKINVEIDIDLKDLNDNQPKQVSFNNQVEERTMEHNIIEDIENDIMNDIIGEDIIEEDIIEEDEDENEEEEEVIEKYVNKGNKKEGKTNYMKYLKYLGLLIIAGVCVYYLFFTSFDNTENKGDSCDKKKLDTNLDNIDLDVDSDSSVNVVNKKSSKRSSKHKIDTNTSENVEISNKGGDSLLEQLRKIREQ
tara:strand:+ start:4584 stop:5420 length:837 start_codon:yes stop_codon:yes gene_type:complete